jgi:hypothetical protein
LLLLLPEDPEVGLDAGTTFMPAFCAAATCACVSSPRAVFPVLGSYTTYVCFAGAEDEDEPLLPDEDELPPPEDELPPPEDELPPPPELAVIVPPALLMAAACAAVTFETVPDLPAAFVTVYDLAAELVALLAAELPFEDEDDFVAIEIT